MEIATLLTPAIGAIATTIAVLVKDRHVRDFENRTKRMLFWKTAVEAGTLADVPESDLIVAKDALRREVLEATRTIAVKQNKFLSRTALLPSLGWVFIVAIILGQIGTMVERDAFQKGVSREDVTTFALIWLAAQIVALLYAGIRCHSFLKHWLWEQVKPGGHWHRVLDNQQLQGVVEALAGCACLALICLSRDLMALHQ